jgi:ADP-ribosylation factor 1/2
MGNLFTKLYDYFYKLPECKLMMGGLDAAGKTTLLYKMKLGEVITTTPTIGFNVETISVNNMEMNIWDIGARSKSFALYKHYFNDLDVFILVVDSSDPERFPEIQENIFPFFGDHQLENVLILVLANKQDLENALNCSEIVEKLELNKLKQTWNILPISGIKGTGIHEAFQWVGDEMSKRKK